MHEIYSQSLLKCFIIIFKSIHETRTLTHAINGYLGGENKLNKAKFSYCHKLTTFRIVSFLCSKEACQQLSEMAYCPLLK